MFRYRNVEKHYKQLPKPARCPFCHPADIAERKILATTTHALVISAQPSYHLWEFRDVIEHLLVVPRRHVRSLGELSPQERLAIMDIICDYEQRDYNVYARSVHSVKRTVPLHQHTHLIKTHVRHPKAAVFIEKPYILFKM